MQPSTSAFVKTEPSSAALASLLPYGVVLIIALYLLVSGHTLLILRWHYVGGGSSIEKLHPATYLLIRWTIHNFRFSSTISTVIFPSYYIRSVAHILYRRRPFDSCLYNPPWRRLRYSFC